MIPFRSLLLTLFLSTLPGHANDVAAAMRLMKSNCFSCHNEAKHKGGLVMTSRDALLKGGDGGDPALVAGEPEKSGLIVSLGADADPHMPPKKQMTPAQIDLLTRWVKEGAKWDDSALAAPPSAPRAVTLAPMPAGYRPVLALALSPDGTQLATGSANELVLYSVTGKEPQAILRASAHPDAVKSIAWSPDGKRLATGSFRRVVIWDVGGLAAEIVITRGLTDRINAVRFSPDGKQLFLADGRIGEEGIVRIADAQSGAITASWTAHSDTIGDLALSADGKLVATAGSDKLVKLWDAATHREMAKFEGHTAQVLSVGFDPKGSKLISGGADREGKVWDVKTRERVAVLGKHTDAITGLTWANAVFAVADGGYIERFDEIKTGAGTERSGVVKGKRYEAVDGALDCLAVAADGSRVFAGAQDGRIFAWDKDGKVLWRFGANEEVKATGPSFVRDVLPVLSRAGCNAGACHAKPEGQNGFRLTVFSYDPKADHRALTREAHGRRTFPAAPEESLFLLKATEAVPHEGGERFSKDSEAYRTLLAWIRGGMLFRAEGEPNLEKLVVTPGEQTYTKGARQPLRVEAIYSDRSKRDVTALASFESSDKEVARVSEEGVVTIGKTSGQAVIIARFMGMVGDSRIVIPADKLLPAEKYTSLPVKNFIDELAYEQFKRLGLYPSQPCTDAEFIRRATLDTIGRLPTVEEAREFLANPDRDKLIDRLLEHPAYADYWANKWADLLRPPPDRAGVKSVFVLDQWLRESFRENKPYDQFVREIVTTEGNTHRYGPAVIYRDKRDPADLTTMFSQLFLGVRLDCAKCHHHPNEKWGQDDFYQFAAFFGPLKRKGAGISAPISAGNETFYFAPGRSVKHPVTGELLEPKAPDGPQLKAGDTDARAALADWLADRNNPFFARAIANRVWGSFFGRGIVEPVDDFRISNPPSNPALLDGLGRELIAKKFNLKELMRTILRSNLYQLSAIPNEFNAADTRNFSRSYRRRLPAEVLADAVADVTGVPDDFPGMPPGSRAMQAWTYKIESQTMDAFGRPNPSSDTPCERDPRPSIVQALHLMNSRLLHEKLTSKEANARIKRLAESKLPAGEVVTELYLATYSRKPTEEEVKTATAAFEAPGADRRAVIEDIAWALMNSAEFVFNH